MSKRFFLHGGSLRKPPIPPASGRRQYEGIENGGLELYFKTAAGIYIERTKATCPATVFSFPVGRGRLSSYIEIKKADNHKGIVLRVIGSASVRPAL